jgi:dTDP-4-dehydrorhamnose 3,5-epimerase
MSNFSFEALPLSGAYLIKPFYSADNRGGFIKDYSQEAFSKNGIEYELKEVFYTLSKKGVIRAIHFQRVKQQPKLVRCIYGHVYDVIVDLRKDSPTFKKWLGFDLSKENMNELLVPSGFGHGYLVLEDSIVSYKCSEKFYPEFDSGIMWNDKTLAVKWPLDLLDGSPVIVSEKDTKLMTFDEFLGCDF